VVRAGVLWLLLVGCTGRTGGTIIVEYPTPAVSDGRLVEAVGIETLGGVFTPLLQKGCALQCELTQVFSTADDRQREILIRLFRGNGNLVNEAHALGTYRVSGFSAAPRGEVQIQVRFIVTQNGIELGASEIGRASNVQIARAAP
jgi:molecular chaperone DnaK